MLAPVLIAVLLLAPATVSGPILHLSQYDYVYPRISPDGRRLVVGRVYVRPEIGETTDVLLIDLVSGTRKLLITREEAEKHETYETYLVGLEWVDGETALVSVSDGDVGVTELLVEASSGRILRTEHSEDELYSNDFAAIARDAARYSSHFTLDELQSSLATDAKRIDAKSVLILRHRFDEKQQALFLIDTAEQSAARIATVPSTRRLADVARVHDQTFALLLDDGVAEIISLGKERGSKLASWDTGPSNECARFQPVGRRLFVLLRPCSRSEPVSAELWELVGNRIVPQRTFGKLDEFSASADGRRIAVGIWVGEKREVRVLDSSSLRPAD